MKPIFLLPALLLAPVNPIFAQETTSAVASAVVSATAPALATKTPFLTGLKEPQGLLRDADGSILVAEYKGGRISRFSPTGQPLGTVATGLKTPALLLKVGGALYATDRLSNRVLRIKKGVATPVGGEIPEPLGLTAAPDGTLFVVSHTTSTVFRFNGKQWQPFYQAPAVPGEAKPYGYRCLAYDGGALLLSDEISGHLFMLTQSGRLATWAKDMESPSGIAIGPDGAIYATDEGHGGQLLKISAAGMKTVIAEALGRPRDILFLNARTALVSDRNGTVWQVHLP